MTVESGKTEELRAGECRQNGDMSVADIERAAMAVTTRIQEPSPKDIQNVKSAMREWVREGYRLKLAGKLHGMESFKLGDTLCDGILTAYVGLRQTVTDGVAEYARSAFKQDWKRRFPDLAIRPRGFFERFVLDEFGLYDLFATHIAGDSPESARRGGEVLMHGLAGYLLR